MHARPIVKWAGGKTKLLPSLLAHVPKRIGTYVEPFAGGAALFFALASEPKRRFERAVLCDANWELVNCYRIVRTDVGALIKALKRYRYDESMFYRIRARDPETMASIARAARFIYLNRTCFNGLYRVNSKGRFNVPFGRYENPSICDEDVLRAASRALSCASVVHGDFTCATRALRAADFVYFDPPYVPLSQTSDFTRYTAGGFGMDDQKRLANEMKRLADMGVGVMLSNADTRGARRLYSGFAKETVEAPRAINAVAKKRGNVRELLVTA
jgi:DNA adenine methylase